MVGWSVCGISQRLVPEITVLITVPPSPQGFFGPLELCLQIRTLDTIRVCTGGSLQKCLSLVFLRTYTMYALEHVAGGTKIWVPTFASRLQGQGMLRKHDGKTRSEI
jgi:hypothetical protein